MKIDVATKSGRLVAVLSGELDEAARRQFEAQLHPQITRRGAVLLIDMSAVSRISSAGLGHLVSLAARANTNGSRLILVSPTPFVSGVLKTTRLDRFFEIAETMGNAEQLLVGPDATNP
jgi:anti-anti-sigma factor